MPLSYGKVAIVGSGGRFRMGPDRFDVPVSAASIAQETMS